MRRLFLALFLASCSKTVEPPPAPKAAPNPSSGRITELLALLNSQDGKGVHGAFHQIKIDEEREYWKLVSSLPECEKGDEILAAAIDRVYTRYDANYYHGTIWHWPYLNSRRTVLLVDKLIGNYPASPLCELALWLKAFALRCPPAEANEHYATSFDNYREQAAWTPDVAAARKTLGDLAARYPHGRFAAISRQLLEAVNLTAQLPQGPEEPDPRALANPTPIRPGR